MHLEYCVQTVFAQLMDAKKTLMLMCRWYTCTWICGSTGWDGYLSTQAWHLLVDTLHIQHWIQWWRGIM